MHANLKRRLAIGVVVMAAAAFAGGAYAATKDSNASVRQAFLNDVAKRLHVTPQKLTSALEGAAVDQINAAVAAGKLTQAQAKALKQRVQKGHVLLGALGLFRVAPVGPGNLRPRLFPGPGNFRPRLFPGPGVPRAFPAPVPALPPGGPVAGAAGYLGLSRSQLLKELSSGKSLAQIAKAQGKPVSGLEAAMVAKIKARLDKAVARKMLTSAQEQRILKGFSAAIGNLVNRAPGFGFVRPGRGMPWRSAPLPPPGPAAVIPPPPAGPPA